MKYAIKFQTNQYSMFTKLFCLNCLVGFILIINNPLKKVKQMRVWHIIIININTVHVKNIQEEKWICALQKDAKTCGTIILILESNGSQQKMEIYKL